jgi:hypothetical protein
MYERQNTLRQQQIKQLRLNADMLLEASKKIR